MAGILTAMSDGNARQRDMEQAIGRRRTLEGWFGTPAGRALWSREERVIRRLVSECFGHHGLEVGTPSGSESLLADCTLGHRVRLSVDGKGRLEGAFVGYLDSLALRPRSIVAAVLVHVVDYHPAPGSTLAAVEQALAPGALLVVSGFNPWHPAILRSQYPKARDWAPRNRCSAHRCRLWLESLHLETDRPVFAKAADWPEGSVRERLARTLPLGTSYVLVARKRERGRLGIPMSSRLSRRLAAPGLPRPTNRSMKDTAA